MMPMKGGQRVMKDNDNGITVLWNIKIHSGKFEDIAGAMSAFDYLIYNMRDIINQKDLYALTSNTGYAMGSLGMCRYLGILDQPDVDKLAAVIANTNRKMTEKITRELRNGNGE
jgi:hypothetical protein